MKKAKKRVKAARRGAKFLSGETDPVDCAKSAGLRYVADHDSGIARLRHGKGFRYVDAQGKAVKDAAVLKRIRSLVLPPAWEKVWICPYANGHLQATGRDARGRKQYRYHPRWNAFRGETKYGRMLAFGKALPQIRKHVEKDLTLTGLPKTKVLATIIQLLESTLVRIGNEEYARENNSIGLTTMRNKHVRIDGTQIHFEFRGKSGVHHAIDLKDRKLARIIRQCRDLPGHELFQYVDDNETRHVIDSSDVNLYLKEISGDEFSAKDFRTWAGTVLAARALQEFESFDSKTQAKKNIVRAIEMVAKRLGNTKAVCRKCYIHPEVIEGYVDGTLLNTLKCKVEHELTDSIKPLPAEEAAVLAFLQERLRRDKEALKEAA